VGFNIEIVLLHTVTKLYQVLLQTDVRRHEHFVVSYLVHEMTFTYYYINNCVRSCLYPCWQNLLFYILSNM